MKKKHEINGIFQRGEIAISEQQTKIEFGDSIKPNLRGPHGGVIDLILLDNPKREYQVENVSNSHSLTIRDND